MLGLIVMRTVFLPLPINSMDALLLSLRLMLWMFSAVSSKRLAPTASARRTNARSIASLGHVVRTAVGRRFLDIRWPLSGGCVDWGTGVDFVGVKRAGRPVCLLRPIDDVVNKASSACAGNFHSPIRRRFFSATAMARQFLVEPSPDELPRRP